MRNAFATEATALAGMDPRLVLLSGDIGNRLFDNIKSQYPNRFFNCGVAEANMVSMASGLALCGLRPVTYTINSFMTTRCYEQIRDDVCYHNLPVVIVGVGGGLSYASLGGTHHSCEDIAIMRVLPSMAVVCPGDPIEVRLALRAALQRNGPTYIRLGKKGERTIHQENPAFSIGRGIVLQFGRDVCLLSTGNTLSLAMEAAAVLDREGIATQVVSLHTVKPLDHELLSEVFIRCSVITTIEEHSIFGGLGGAVAEWLADQNRMKGRLIRIATSDAFFHESGDQEYARQYFGLVPTAIAGRIRKTLEEL